MNWNIRNDAPVYTQLVDQIARAIILGQFPPGSKLPSVRDFASDAGVNPNTMQRALAELERLELIRTQRTAGRTVTEDLARIDREKRRLAQAGIEERVRFHDLRHTFATHALTSGVDVKTLSGILGHTRAAFTLDTYTHTTGDMQRRAAEIVGEFLTDVFGEELRSWEENGKMEKELSA